MGRRASDKRERLVLAAAGRFHRDGLNGSSIADIARDADVPVGNVFYYFRTKDELIRAVVDHWVARIQSAMDSLLREALPERRLEAFLDNSAARADVYATMGCPLVALARDLRQSGNALSPLAADIIHPQVDWIDRMFAAMGIQNKEKHRAAQGILAALQGSFQMAFALADSDIIYATVEELKERVRILKRTAKT
jgi:AcrR family transcriptional regulator